MTDAAHLPVRGEVEPQPAAPAETAAPDAAPAPAYRTATDPRLRVLVPLVVAIAFFMESLDSTIIATSLPQIAHSFGESPLRLSLAITSYLVSLAIFMPISGWIADRFGARSVFCAAIALFTLGSALCGMSQGLGMMVAMRVLQGMGGAMMTPVGRLIMLRSFPREQVVAALSFMAIPALIGPSLGPLVGGYFTTYFSWRWIFYINLPIGLIGIVFVLRFIENFHMRGTGPFDFRGFAIVGLGLALLQLAIEYLGRDVVPAPLELGLFVAAFGVLFAYVRHARRCASPVLDLGLLRIRSFRIAVGAGSLCRAGIGAVPFLLPLLFQIGFGLSAMQSGLLTFVAGAGAVLMRGAVPAILRRLGFRRLLVGNGLLVSATIAGIALLSATTPAWLVMIYLLIFGFLRASQFSSIVALGYADLDAAGMSKGTSMMSVAQQLSLSFGIALGATLLAVVGGSEPRITAADFRLVFVIVALMPLLSVASFLRLSPLDGIAMSGHRAASPPARRGAG